MGFENFASFGSGLSSVGGFASSLIGGIGGAITARKNRKLARELAQKQQDFQAAEAEKAYQRDIAMWERQNAYNAPSAQMQRLIDAGLNPNLAYQSLGSSTAQSAPSYNPPSAVAPSDAAFSDPYESISQMGTNLSNTSVASAQVAQLRANTNNVELQNFRLALENATLLPAQIQDLLNEYAYNKQARPQALALGAINLNRAAVDLQSAQKSLSMLDTQLSTMKHEERIKAIEASFAELTKGKKFEALCAEYDMTIERGKHYAEILKNEMLTGQYNAQTAYARMLEESNDNELQIQIREENKNKAEIKKGQNKGQKATVGDPNTKIGKVTKWIQVGSGFLKSVVSGIADIASPAVEKVISPLVKATK